jgi:hypothetical protein
MKKNREIVENRESNPFPNDHFLISRSFSENKN